MRLDVYLVQNGFASTRERAQELIRSGAVLVNGVCCRKNSYPVPENASLSVTSDLKYVGRGGWKLEKALNSFHLTTAGKTVLDIGASTGGFTDCALQHGALFVTAVDVGHGQLAASLCSDPRVRNLEGVHVRDIGQYYHEFPDFVCVDVSFLSLTKVLPFLLPFLTETSDLVTLVKPQFEIRHKKSVIRDPKIHRSVLHSVAEFARGCGLGILGADFSPFRGTEGNIEYLLYMKRNASDRFPDWNALVSSAHKTLKERSGSSDGSVPDTFGSES